MHAYRRRHDVGILTTQIVDLVDEQKLYLEAVDLGGGESTIKAIKPVVALVLKYCLLELSNW